MRILLGLVLSLSISFSLLAEESKFINALIAVESNGDTNAIGDNGKAFGCLQIHKCVIKDVNQIYKTSYQHYEMFDRQKSIDVCKKYLTFWSKMYKENTGKKVTWEVLARLWNGGPMFYLKKNKTDSYWKKVKKAINKNKRKIK